MPSQAYKMTSTSRSHSSISGGSFFCKSFYIFFNNFSLSISYMVTIFEIFLVVPVRLNFASLAVYIDMTIASTHLSISNLYNAFRCSFELPVSSMNECPLTCFPSFFRILIDIISVVRS